jgi:hypothetical protein
LILLLIIARGGLSSFGIPGVENTTESAGRAAIVHRAANPLRHRCFHSNKA